MRRILGSILLLTLAVGAQAANLIVTVQNPAGGALPGVQVLALSFNNGKPDPTVSMSNVTDGSGQVSLPLSAGTTYQILASSHGFRPSLLEQFGGTPPSLLAGALAQTLVISSIGVSGVGEIRVPVTGPIANRLIFGQVGLKTGGGASAFGVAATDGSGNALMRFVNVTTAPAIYQVSVYDPSQDLSTGTPVNLPLGTGGLTLSGLSLTPANAQRPVANIGQAQTAGGAGLSVYGVVTDTTTAANPIPYLQINFQSQYVDTRSSQTFNDWRGAQSDQNGVFQLYDLRPGSTYYTTIYGGCDPQGNCYRGFQSAAAGTGIGAAPGAYDFVFVSTASVLYPKIKLNRELPSNGTLSVYVKDQYGHNFFQAGIGLSPDGMLWQTPNASSDCAGSFTQNPGFKNLNAQASTGYYLLTGLPSGNYQLHAWTPYGGTSFNAGPDGQQNYSCSTSTPGADDQRLTIDTAATAGMAGIYNIYGNQIAVGLSSVTITVNIPTGTLTGVIQGTMKFPSVVDLSLSPISIVLYPNCSNNSGPCQGGDFRTFDSASTGPVVNYSIPVSSGQSYYMQVLSNYWGAVYPGGNQPQPDLTKTSTATVNMNFFPAGRVTGSMRKPDGSLYVPPTGNNAGSSPSVNAQGKNSWGSAQINADGTFSIGGLLPGDYTLVARADGATGFPYTTKQPAARVTAIVNSTVSQDLYLADAVTVKPLVSTSTLPSMNIVTCPADSQGDCPPQTWKTYALPQGTPFSPLTVTNLLVGGGGESTPGLFFYSKSTGRVNSNGCNGQFLTAAGFCTSALAASKAGSTFDFYLLRSGGFDSEYLDRSEVSATRPYFVIESSTKGIIVGPTYVNSVAFSPMGGMSGSTTAVQEVSVQPVADLSTLPQARLTGTVTVTRMINLRQFQSLGGNFDKFTEFLPVVWVYDAAGALKAAGIVVPDPPNMGKDKPLDAKLNKAVADGDFAQFQALTGPVSGGGWGPLGFDIRGLTANTPYSLVVTTPNYPPYKTSVTLGAATSITTADVNLDSNAGSTLSGVVQSTATVPFKLSGAQVTVKASGYGPTTLTTDSSGYWTLNGLGAGQYQVSAVAAGYAQAIQGVDVGGSGFVTVPAFSLSLANSSISGTVYTNNPVCPAGATCSAFGKTVLQGIPVLAYDDTLNVSDPAGQLPLSRAVTDSSGSYKLSGLTDAQHRFKVFVNAPGYYVANSTVDAVGNVVGFDFALKPKPLDLNIFGRPSGDDYEFQITNAKDFSSGNAWVGASPFVMATSTPLSQNAFFQRPDADGNTQLFLSYSTAALTAGVQYTLHLEAQPNDPRADKVIKEVPFGLGLPHAVCQSVDQALIGDEEGVNSQGVPNNHLPIDNQGGEGGNGSGISMPVGSMIPNVSTAIPSMCMSETDVSSSAYLTSAIRSAGLTRAAFASGVYNVSLSSIQYTVAKGVDLTLYYDQSGTSLDDLAIYHYDAATQKWGSVPGLQTIDPMKGTISVKGLKSLASVLSVSGAKGAAAQTRMGLMAVSDGRGYRPNALPAATDSGVYAVLKPSQVNGGAYTGTVVKVFNFPNPFNLQPKSVTLNTSGGVCSGGAGLTVTGGTVIKYEIPAGISGQGVIRLYTVSGRLVRELDAGAISPSSCYYTQWDGRNRSGQPVANGVYYGILSVGGSAQTSATFKLAVIK